MLQLQYSGFITHLDQGNIAELTVTETLVEGHSKEPVEGKEYFVAHRIDPEFASTLDQYDITYTGASDQNFFTNLVSLILPVLLFVGLWYFLIRRMSGGQGLARLSRPAICIGHQVCMRLLRSLSVRFQLPSQRPPRP